MSAFQIRLKALREEKKMSQREFAEIFGVAQSTVGNWEAGIREPELETIKRLADYFDVSTDFLLGRNTFSSDSLKNMLESDLRMFAKAHPNAPFNVLDQKSGIVHFFERLPGNYQEKMQKNVNNLLEAALTLADDQHQDLVHLVFVPYIQNLNTEYKLLDVNLGLFGESNNTISTRDMTLLGLFHRLNDEGQGKVVDYTDDLVHSGKYSPFAAKTG